MEFPKVFSMRESTNKLKTPVWAPAALFALACGAGACSAVLDFTECRTDEDCSTFFVDNRPMYCNETEGRCKVKNPGCDATADCENHSENSICGLSNECFELLVGEETPCEEPEYPGGSGEYVYIGSIVDGGATYASGVEHAIELALADFNASSTIDGKKVAWIRCDSAGNPAQAAAAAEYLAGKSAEADGDIVGVGVAGVIGPFEDVAFKKVAEVSLASGVNAFTISPAAVGAIATPPDPTGVVWRGNAGAERQGEAILARINQLAPSSIQVLYGNEAAGDYAQSMYEAMVTGMTLNLSDGVGGVQSHLLYNSAITPADLVGLLDPKELMLVIGGDEVGDILTEYVNQGLALPKNIIVAGRGGNGVLAAVTNLGGAASDLISVTEVIAPDVQANTMFRARLMGQFPGEAPGAFVELAYDSTVMTLLASAARMSTSGPNVAKGMQSLVSGTGTPVGQRADEVQAAAQLLLGGGTIDLMGTSGDLSLDFNRRDVCHSYTSYKVSGTVTPNLVPSHSMAVNCLESSVGTWTE